MNQLPAAHLRELLGLQQQLVEAFGPGAGFEQFGAIPVHGEKHRSPLDLQMAEVHHHVDGGAIAAAVAGFKSA